jgi:eukaryotic-like serine/threonine-protein kinase
MPIQKATPPPPPQPATDITVRNHTEPPGAGVFLDDVQIGTTPMERRMKRDAPTQLTFRLASYQDTPRKLDYSGSTSDVESVDVTLVPLAKVVPAAPAPAAEPTARPARPASKSTREKDDSITIYE